MAEQTVCERCGLSYHPVDAEDNVCEVCLTELKEDELYEAYTLACSAKGVQPLMFDEWIKLLSDVDDLEKYGQTEY